MVSVGLDVEIDGSLLDGVFLGVLHGFDDAKDVLAVALDARDHGVAGVVVAVLGGTRVGSAHRVVVVFADEDHR